MLTILFTSLNMVGLVVLAVAFLHTYADQQQKLLESDLQGVTSTVSRLLQYDNNTLVTAFIREDQIDNQCPQFAVLPGASGTFPGYFSSRTCVPMDSAMLGGLAHDAAQSGHILSGLQYGTDGRRVWVLADPVRNPTGQYIGAVVAVADAGPDQATYDLLVLVVVGGCLLGIAALATTGYLLAGRAIRPAAIALEQQEKSCSPRPRTTCERRSRNCGRSPRPHSVIRACGPSCCRVRSLWPLAWEKPSTACWYERGWRPAWTSSPSSRSGSTNWSPVWSRSRPKSARMSQLPRRPPG
ncbi:hypothetical protein [Fodinicola feengrottensis]|uniref:hypothetical protein n=1 Tax=Fodinicola feengrottensis TaxID=435914 RepID=UPI0024421354|nr:hypothetical protein [Fodinicola feengrottensis]